MKNKNDYVITKSVIDNSSAAWDVFLNKFDITWATDSRWKDGSKELTVTPIEQGQGADFVDDGSIKYSYNNEWFRSDDFTTNHPEKHHLLFAGCSETEGIASPVDEVWSKMLHNDLKNNGLDVGGFYSIARAGYGWQKIITNFMIYVEKYGFPTHLFVLLPNLGRGYRWKDDESAWFYIQKFPFKGPVAEKEETFFQNNTTPEDHKQFFIDFSVGWQLFEKYCESNGVKLLCSIWDYLDGENLERFKHLKSFFLIREDHEIEDFTAEMRPNGKLLDGDLRRRDGHSGRIYHQYWLSKFQDEMKKRGILND
jgi:hypothetical protein